MHILYNTLFAFMAAVGYSVMFNAPKSNILKAGFGGAMGWMVYLLTVEAGYSTIIGSFFGAVTVGLIGEFFANRFKKPATSFIIPGITPLVPGYGVYYTMISIIEKNYVTAASKGSEAIFIAVAIASGLIISSTIGRAIRSKKRRSLMNGQKF